MRVRTITIRFFEAQWCRNMTVNSKSLKFSRLRYTPYCCFQYLAFSIYFFLSTSLPFPNLYRAIFHSQPIVNAKTEGTAEMPPITQKWRQIAASYRGFGFQNKLLGFFFKLGSQFIEYAYTTFGECKLCPSQHGASSVRLVDSPFSSNEFRRYVENKRITVLNPSLVFLTFSTKHSSHLDQFFLNFTQL